MTRNARRVLDVMTYCPETRKQSRNEDLDRKLFSCKHMVYYLVNLLV